MHLSPETLPIVQGRYTFNAPLAPQVWFRVGGPAEVLFKPKNVEDLQHFLRGLPAQVPVLPIGVGSNLLVRDGGVPGVVVRLGPGFATMERRGDILFVGAGALDRMVAEYCAHHALAGLEFLYGIPGTIGGALRMNAGAYGREIKDVLVQAYAVDRSGQLITLSLEEMGFTYRKSAAARDLIFVGADLRVAPGDGAGIRAAMQTIQAAREATQPVRARTGGSTFKNPDGPLKAWQLIDAAGYRGYQIGGAQVSPLHCNFLLNTGEATAADLETLGETVRAAVLKTSGVALYWEIERVGRPL